MVGCLTYFIVSAVSGSTGQGYTTNAQDTLIAIYLDNTISSLTHAYPVLRGCEALRMFRTGMRIG